MNAAKRSRRHPLPRAAALLLAAAALAGCNAFQRMAEVGSEPKMSPIENPTEHAAYRPVSMPMPAPIITQPSANSLWRPGARSFFKDQRAAEVGDILTVVVNITGDKAVLNNESVSQRKDVKDTANLTSFMGYEQQLADILPDGVAPAALVNFDSGHKYDGVGSIKRDETISLRLAAVITQVLPNGNLVVAGRQEIRVNYELREVHVSGVIRPQDIKSDNSIDWDKIAEARIAYGGRGTMSDMQQPRYGQQIFDILFPW